MPMSWSAEGEKRSVHIPRIDMKCLYSKQEGRGICGEKEHTSHELLQQLSLFGRHGAWSLVGTKLANLSPDATTGNEDWLPKGDLWCSGVDGGV